jgi:tRNA threonylcarbamoyladenosine biosynthesis protein TsaB
MMLLAIDTSTRVVGVALYDENRVLSEEAWLSRNHHTVELGPAVAATLARLHVQCSELCAIGVAIGPGSFTGLRIGLALAKGLAFSQNIPIVGIPTLDVLVAAQPVTERKLVGVLEAGRRRLAVGWYQAVGGHWKSKGALENLTVNAFIERIQGPILVCGELSEVLRHEMTRDRLDVRLTSPAQSIRRPAFLAELAWKRWQNGDIDDPSTLKPIYLHFDEPIPG